MNITSIVTKSTILRLHPEAWDFFFPHGPAFGTAIREYIVGTLVRQIRHNFDNRQFATQLDAIAKALVETSARMLPSDFAKESVDTDDLCPPYLGRPLPPPPRGDEGSSLESRLGGVSAASMFDSSSIAWLEHAPAAIKEIALAVALRNLANVTTVESVSFELKKVGEAVMKQASGKAFEEYCATPAKPRVPVTPHKAIA
jgi:hypothetical protein